MIQPNDPIKPTIEPSTKPSYQLGVELGERSYSINIIQGLLSQPRQLAEQLHKLNLGQQIAIITNPTIAKHYLTCLNEALGDYQSLVIFIDDGEKYKNWASLCHIHDQLMNAQFNRHSSIIALGGGVVGDIAGFAAATWMRGIRCIQIPTTLLAQVDSSVGGKTGINHPKGKNMIGTFHQPTGVFIDCDTLSTLPLNQLKSGLAEVVKYGLIWDKSLFQLVNEQMHNILNRQTNILQKIIYRSCQIKADIVAKDERENHLRALLNLGHTFGHAIESLTHYEQFLHGEAISIGMVLAANMSRLEGYLNSEQVLQIQQTFERFGLPTQIPTNLDPQTIINAMQYDKKKADHSLPLILLERIGKAIKTHDYQTANLRQCFKG